MTTSGLAAVMILAAAGAGPIASADDRKNKRQRYYGDDCQPSKQRGHDHDRGRGHGHGHSTHRKSCGHIGHCSCGDRRVNIDIHLGGGYRSRSSYTSRSIYYCPPSRPRYTSYSYRYDPCPPPVVYCPPRTTYSHTTYVVNPTPRYDPPTTKTVVVTTSLDPEWKLLATGCGPEARVAFAREAEMRPDDELAKIGYSIASAMVGDDELAVLWMRRALRSGMSDLTCVPDDAGLRRQIDEMRDHYRELARNRVGDTDAYFMIASLSVIVGDYDEASYAIGRAVEFGDNDASTTSLQRHIRLKTSGVALTY